LGDENGCRCVRRSTGRPPGLPSPTPRRLPPRFQRNRSLKKMHFPHTLAKAQLHIHAPFLSSAAYTITPKKRQHSHRMACQNQNRIINAANLSGPLEDDGKSATFYTHVLCPYAQRAWLALLEKVTLRTACYIPEAQTANCHFMGTSFGGEGGGQLELRLYTLSKVARQGAGWQASLAAFKFQVEQLQPGMPVP